MNLVYLFLLIVILYTIVYVIVYPSFVKNNLQKLLIGDAIVSICILVIIGIRFWNTGEHFNFLLFSTNWFIATLICELIADCFFVYFYNRRYKLFGDLND